MSHSPPARAAAFAAVALLAGCPLPQPLSEYPTGQPVTPPRVLTSAIRVAAAPETESFIRVPASCPGPAPTYDLSATLYDLTTEIVQARWFVDYDPANELASSPVGGTHDISPPVDPLVFSRPVSPFTFNPYDFAAPPGTGSYTDHESAGIVHVVELVVSNGFDPAADTFPAPAGVPLPFRTAKTGFETQVYRWVFQLVQADQPVQAQYRVSCPP